MRWRNWTGYVSCEPARLERPRSEEQIREILSATREDSLVRVVGAGHSFTPLVPSDDVLLSLEDYTGIVDVDRDKNRVTVRAGTTLRELGKLLHGEGLAQENLGDIDKQTIAGAVSTGTHGTGARLGSISTQIEAVTLIDASGEKHRACRDENRELFDAARVSLGALGILSEITLRVVPSHRLHYRLERTTVDRCLARLDEHVDANRHFEFYWFPHSDWVQLKRLNKTDKPATRDARLASVVLENGVFGMLSELCRWFPSTCERVSRLCGRLVTTGEGVRPSKEVHISPRLVRFQEMEYCVPRSRFREVFDEIRAEIARQRFRVHFPIECRFVAADDIWLSPSFERDSALIAVHMFRGMPWEGFFRAIETIFLRHEGRPHWGKWHSRTSTELSTLYPRWDGFLRVRRDLDPMGRFLNPHLRELFGND